jgi:hypothetical protein
MAWLLTGRSRPDSDPAFIWVASYKDDVLEEIRISLIHAHRDGYTDLTLTSPKGVRMSELEFDELLASEAQARDKNA